MANGAVKPALKKPVSKKTSGASHSAQESGTTANDDDDSALSGGTLSETEAKEKMQLLLGDEIFKGLQVHHHVLGLPSSPLRLGAFVFVSTLARPRSSPALVCHFPMYLPTEVMCFVAAPPAGDFGPEQDEGDDGHCDCPLAAARRASDVLGFRLG